MCYICTSPNQAKHENIRYRCEHCNHVLNSKMALKTHMGTKHATIKPFACGQCGDCFALQSLLTAHMNAKYVCGYNQYLLRELVRTLWLCGYRFHATNNPLFCPGSLGG